MSSHREAPEISKDPVADNTDVYAFVSPDAPDTVTLIANYIPLEEPAGGPNFYRFGDEVMYEIKIDNNGDAIEDITYQFRFTTQIKNPNTFLYNTGPIASLDDPNWNVRQTYTVTRVAGGTSTVLGTNLPTPPVRIGPRSTPNYPALAGAAVQTLASGEKVFCGQRADPFFVDLGAIFDLGDLRPLQNLHLVPTPAAGGQNGLKGYNVHTIAIQVPKTRLTRDGSAPTDVTDARSVIGVYASASRPKARVIGMGMTPENFGPWIQVSRLGNPLINEVLVPLGKKDLWNQSPPSNDAQFRAGAEQPELAKLLPVLYPGVFPNLAKLTAARADLVAILMTGIPAGIVPNFQNFTGATLADLLRLNMAIPPASNPNVFGVVGGDLAGFPNGRRLTDDVVTIELRAIAGATYPLVAPGYTPDAAVNQIEDGLLGNDPAVSNSFPYMAIPNEGFEHRHAP